MAKILEDIRPASKVTGDSAFGFDAKFIANLEKHPDSPKASAYLAALEIEENDPIKLENLDFPKLLKMVQAKFPAKLGILTDADRSVSIHEYGAKPSPTPAANPGWICVSDVAMGKPLFKVSDTGEIVPVNLYRPAEDKAAELVAEFCEARRDAARAMIQLFAVKGVAAGNSRRTRGAK